MRKLISTLVCCGALIALGYFLLASNPTVAYPQNPREWTAEMREQYPAEFAKLSEKALKADLATIDGRLEGLQASAGKIAKRYEDAQKKFAFGEKHAADLVAAKQAGKFPVEILGTKYEEHQLQSQMKQVCGELKVHQKTLTAIKKASKVLEKQKMDLRLYRTECQGQLDILAANVEVFKAKKLSLDGLNLLTECADVLQGSGSYLANLDPVADIETLMKRAEAEAEQTADGDDLDLEAFLNNLGADAAEEETSDNADFGGLEEFVDVDGKKAEASETTVDSKSVEEPKL